MGAHVKRIDLNLHEALGFTTVLCTWGLLLYANQIFDYSSFDLTRYLKLHLGSSLILALGFQLFMGKLRPAFTVGNLLLHLSLPVIGSFFALILVVTLTFSRKSNLLTDFHEEDKSLASQMKPTSKAIANPNETLKRNLSVEPIVETIRSNAHPDLKRGAIETLSSIPSPSSVSLLKEALGDNNSEVRFYASSGLARVEECLNTEIVKFKKAAKDEPTLSHHLSLAQAYYEFVYLKIQDEASLQYYLKQAILNFEVAHSLDPQHTGVLKGLERAYMRAGEAEKALQLRPEKERGQEDTLMIAAETHFRNGDLKVCRAVLEGISESHWDAVKDVMRLWFPGEEKRA